MVQRESSKSLAKARSSEKCAPASLWENWPFSTIAPGINFYSRFSEIFNKKLLSRTASVQALSDVQLWVLDRSVFQMITQRLGMERHNQLMNFLTKVGKFKKKKSSFLSISSENNSMKRVEIFILGKISILNHSD